MATDSKQAYEITSPLLTCVSQAALDAVFGAAALVDTNQNLLVLGRNWNEFMARSGRADLTKNSVLGSSLLQFFRDEQQRQVFKNLLESMANDELGTHNQVVDLGQKDHPYYIQFHVQPIWSNGLHLGYFLHCIDTTKEHTTRLTLIDHDRQLLKLRQEMELNESELNAAKELLSSVAREQAEKDEELAKLREKADRKEKALKAVIKQAELSASSMADKNRDLERLRADSIRLENDLTAANKQLNQSAEALQVRESEASALREEYDSLCKESTILNEQIAEANNLQAQNDSLQNELAVLKDQIAAAKSTDSRTDKKLKEVEQSNAQLEQDLAEIDKERLALHVDMTNLRSELTVANEQYNLLSETLRTAEAEAQSSKLDADIYAELVEFLSQSTQQFGKALCELFRKESNACFTVYSHLEAANQAFRPFAEYAAPEGFKLALENHSDFDKTDNDYSVFTIAIRYGDTELAQIQLFYPEDSLELDSVVLEKLNALANKLSSLVNLAVQLTTIEESREVSQTALVVAPESTPLAEADNSDTHGLRALSSDLANAFGDLLTAVIGHASLAAADADDDSPTLSDIRAIEMSAGEAAKLVRKLHALSGDARHAANADLTSAITGFLKRNYAASDRERSITFDGSNEKIHVAVDHAALEVILKGIASYADMAVDEDSHPSWALVSDEEYAKLTLFVTGEASIPNGWLDDKVPHCDESGYDLYFAREAARAFGGQLDIQTAESSTEIILSLPKALATVDNGW